MKTCLAVLSALALLASLLFFTYLEAERELVWADGACPDLRLRFAMALAAALILFVVPWVVVLFGDDDLYARRG